MGYNHKTFGDICEAWLAIDMRSEVPAARSLACRVEGVVSHLYIVVCEFDIWTVEELDARLGSLVEAD